MINRKIVFYLFVASALLLTDSALTQELSTENATAASKELKPAPNREIINLWPRGLPAGSIKLDAKRVEKLKAKERTHPHGHKLYVDVPTLTVFRATPESANGCSVVVCPGGGYNVLAWQHEGVELAEYFNSIGVTAFVLKYRVPRRIPDKIHWEPMQDVQRAIRVIRHEAMGDNKFNVDLNRIGVLGFSAGGHLAVMAGVQYETKCYEPFDAADKEGARPNFVCPIYAAYLGNGYKDDKAELGSLVTVTKNTPTMFMAVTWDDGFRGAQSALLFARLKENGVTAEFHGYAKGGHGYGIRNSADPVSSWVDRLREWMKSSGLLDRK